MPIILPAAAMSGTVAYNLLKKSGKAGHKYPRYARHAMLQRKTMGSKRGASNVRGASSVRGDKKSYSKGKRETTLYL